MAKQFDGKVVIVGGGVIGAATACFLARDHGVHVTVLEADPTYTRASSALSASSIRQQFSTPVNIALSQWSWRFLQRVGEELAVDGVAPQIGMVEAGYLYLARAEQGADLRASGLMQRRCGAATELLSPVGLQSRWPWLNTGDLALGSWGAQGEGWFDGPALHAAFVRKAKVCGVCFVEARAAGFVAAADRVQGVMDAQGQHHLADAVLIAAGAWSAPLAAQLGLDVPISAKKRDVFVLDSPAVLPGCPLIIDPSGVWLRPEGRGFLAGAPPRVADDDEAPLHNIDHSLFDESIWPALAHRIPAFEALRLRSAWAGYYEMNAFDHNAVVGAIPRWRNAFIAAGFSGHGMQHAPAIGHALAALLAEKFIADAVDIGALSPQRLLDNRPLVESNVI